MFRNLILEACLNEKKNFKTDRKHENEPNENFPKILDIFLYIRP
jgi:hypothetical protein